MALTGWGLVRAWLALAAGLLALAMAVVSLMDGRRK